MRYLFFFLCLFVFCDASIPVKAQHELWGMTYGGGGNWGIIFKTDSSGGNFSVEHMFTTFERHSKGTLIKASNGKYYGMSEGGGLYAMGTIYEYDPATDSVKVLHHFDGANTGSYPKGDLLQASNGKLYGMTYQGGIGNNRGVVFEFNLSDNSFTKIYDFGEYPKGRLPHGSLIQATNGKLYGMTRDGGNIGGGGFGTIFEIDLSGPALTILYTFTGGTADGSHPQGNLIQISDSLLYGLTPEGGDHGQGTLFKFNINTSTHTKLQNFSESVTGGYPGGSLLEASNGNLYGLYKDGYCCGGVFEYDIISDILSQKYDFTYSDGTGPIYSNLSEGESNMFFSMTNRGGAYDDGAIFRYNNAADDYSLLYSFDLNEPNNDNAYGSFVESTPGKYLFMTRVGGTAGTGTISEWDTVTDTYSIKHSFDSFSPGVKPKGSLMAASNGKFYGLAVEGGAYNMGAIFEYDPFTGEYRKLHDFNGASTGANPNGSLIEASDGKFYGLTRWGGNDGQGVLFEYDPASETVTKLHDFGWAPAPGRPVGSLVQASNGKLYGMSSYGGANWNHGAIFEYDISTSTFTVKHNFNNNANVDGRNPEGSLIQTNTDTLYGMTPAGGTNDHGTLFEYIVSTGALTKKHDFNDPSGREPKADLLKAANGKLYGMTNFGGANFQGTIFEYDVQAGSFSMIHSFQGTTTGKNPYGSLQESSNGKLYGMTCGATDASYEGSLFELDTSSNTVIRVIDFDTTVAYKPQYTQLIKILVQTEWTGAVSTDWHDPANWLDNDVPGPFTTVVIPDVSGTSGNFPVVSTNARVKDLTVEPGADLDVLTGVELKVGKEE